MRKNCLGYFWNSKACKCNISHTKKNDTKNFGDVHLFMLAILIYLVNLILLLFFYKIHVLKKKTGVNTVNVLMYECCIFFSFTYIFFFTMQWTQEFPLFTQQNIKKILKLITDENMVCFFLNFFPQNLKKTSIKTNTS